MHQDEIDYNEKELEGSLSIKFANGLTLDDFCSNHISEYSRDRFEALAIRVYVGLETVITVYAIDKHLRLTNSTSVSAGKLPVKKFKISEIQVNELFTYCTGFNCTLSTGNYALEDMEVINR